MKLLAGLFASLITLLAKVVISQNIMLPNEFHKEEVRLVPIEPLLGSN